MRYTGLMSSLFKVLNLVYKITNAISNHRVLTFTNILNRKNTKKLQVLHSFFSFDAAIYSQSLLSFFLLLEIINFGSFLLLFNFILTEQITNLLL